MNEVRREREQLAGKRQGVGEHKGGKRVEKGKRREDAFETWQFRVDESTHRSGTGGRNKDLTGMTTKNIKLH